MPSKFSVPLCTAVALLLAVGPVSAQAASTIDPAALDAATAAAAPDARATIGAALSSERAIATARSMGLSPADIEARLAVLDDATAERLADRILAGGDTITISATLLIIILLLLILITD